MTKNKFWHILSLVLVCSVLSSFVLTQNIMAGDNAWSPIGLYGVGVEALAIDPSNNTTLYAGTQGAGIFKTIDGGSTWTNIGNDIPSLYFSDIAVDPNNNGIVYASVNNGSIYKSTTGGTNWVSLNTGNSFSVAVHPLENNLLLRGDWDGGIFRSVDGGTSWDETIGASTAWMSARVIVFAPNAPHIVYTAGFDGVWKSMDSGQNWVSINSGFAAPPSVWSLAIDPYDSQVVYIGTASDGIYKTTNGGISWLPIGTGLSSSHITAITINPGNQQLMYVGGGNNPGTGTPGVYKSLDNAGLSWTSMMDGMGSRAIYRLILDGSTPRNLYAATIGGMWKYTLVSGITDYSISIDDGALYTNQVDVILNLLAPPGTTEMIISNDGGFSGASWEPFKNQKAWTISAYGDSAIPRIVYAKFKTNGIVSGLYQDDIVLDVTAPTGTVAIDVGAIIRNTLIKPTNVNPSITTSDTFTNTVYLPLVAKNARPGYTVVTLLLSAEDDLSGIDGMLISNKADFTDAQWLPYSSTLEWWVPEAEAITVYVVFQDRAGNQSIIYSANK